MQFPPALSFDPPTATLTHRSSSSTPPKTSYKWDPEDEAVIQNIFHKKATRRLSDTLHQVRSKLAKEKIGEEPSQAALFQATHKRKKTDEFVCKKAQHVMEIVTQIQQTQPELGDSNAWYEAAGSLKKGGYIFGFGSDTPHYFLKL